MKKDSLLENVGQAQAALSTGAIAAYATRYRLFGTLLTVGSGLLGNQNVTENVANFVLSFKSEHLELDNVCLITRMRSI